MTKKVVVAPVGDNMDALYVGINEFPTERVILLAPEDKIEDAKKAQDELKKFGIPVQITEIKGNIWEDMFQKIAEIKALEKGKELIIVVSTCDLSRRKELIRQKKKIGKNCVFLSTKNRKGLKKLREKILQHAKKESCKVAVIGFPTNSHSFLAVGFVVIRKLNLSFKISGTLSFFVAELSPVLGEGSFLAKPGSVAGFLLFPPFIPFSSAGSALPLLWASRF